ncbi:MAG: hypothetical protein FKGGLIKP_00019 [Sodalis sp. Fse]|nr:MAG: hypothetical protein FKGGLIKP_00019 [Sodalis sp. Fse]
MHEIIGSNLLKLMDVEALPGRIYNTMPKIDKTTKNGDL